MARVGVVLFVDVFLLRFVKSEIVGDGVGDGSTGEEFLLCSFGQRREGGFEREIESFVAAGSGFGAENRGHKDEFVSGVVWVFGDIMASDGGAHGVGDDRWLLGEGGDGFVQSLYVGVEILGGEFSSRAGAGEVKINDIPV